MNRDFVEMLSALCAAGARFLIVGAHALAAHGAPRATGDLDIWIQTTPENAERVLSAVRAFGAPLFAADRGDDRRPDDWHARPRRFHRQQDGIGPAEGPVGLGTASS